ncbi:MAG: arsenate reductase family protein [Bacteroidales bacterium]
MLNIYHYPRCKISRQVLEKIYKADTNVEVIEYLKNIPTVKELKVLLAKLNFKPLQIVRKGEILFKQKFKDKNFSDEEWLQIIHENPILIERPIVVRNNKALICRPADKIYELLKQDNK